MTPGGVIAGAVWLLFLGWLCKHAFREIRAEWGSRHPGPRVERAVHASLYPTTGRGTVATPTTAPRRTA